MLKLILSCLCWDRRIDVIQFNMNFPIRAGKMRNSISKKRPTLEVWYHRWDPSSGGLGFADLAQPVHAGRERADSLPGRTGQIAVGGPGDYRNLFFFGSSSPSFLKTLRKNAAPTYLISRKITLSDVISTMSANVCCNFQKDSPKVCKMFFTHVFDV